MSIKIEAGQTHTVTGYPFVRYVANLYDKDDGCPYQNEGWRPGCSREYRAMLAAAPEAKP